MNKIKATKREMRQNYKILGVGYCDMQYLLRYQDPVAYSSGIYGWSCDYYEIDNVIISTGYSYIDTKNMKDDYKLIKQYEEKARQLNDKNKINKLLHKLIKKLQQEL